MFRGAFILVPIAHVMRQRAARREEESSNFTSSETHSPDSPQGRHYFGWLDYKMCSLISCQGCPKNTSLDLCLTRECKLDLRFDYDNCLQLTIRDKTAVVNELEFSYFQPTLIYPTPTSLYYLLRFGFIFPRRTYLGSLAEKSWSNTDKGGERKVLFFMPGCIILRSGVIICMRTNFLYVVFYTIGGFLDLLSFYVLFTHIYSFQIFSYSRAHVHKN